MEPCCSGAGALTERHTPIVGRYLAGHVEPGETPEQAARREALEELGVNAVELIRLDPITYGGMNGAATCHIFVVVR